MAITPLLGLNRVSCIAAIFQRCVDEYNLSSIDGEFAKRLGFSGAHPPTRSTTRARTASYVNELGTGDQVHRQDYSP